MTEFLLVAAGGAAGAVARYGVALLARPVSGAFPWHTLGVNVVGSFLLGLLMACLPQGDAGERLRLLLGVGVLGGFTTFSAFSVDALALAQQDQWLTAAAYVLGSVAAALAGAAAGYATGRAL
ncbi:MAG: fluoride efflux transporter CrcB [Coriobacteriia bacterium]